MLVMMGNPYLLVLACTISMFKAISLQIKRDYGFLKKQLVSLKA